MKGILLSVLAFILISGWSCNQDTTDKEAMTGHEASVNDEKSTSWSVKEGVSMLQIYCYTCHNPNAPSHDEMLAPPLVAVKWRYQQLYRDRETFIRKMTEFSLEPSRDNAVMPGAIVSFGLMPKSPLKEETIRAISAFIYDQKLDEPDWFAAHFEEQHGRKWSQ